jgi:hypothetical protein
MGEDCVLWSFDHFYHMDKANAAIHCAPVKFSPITFRLAHRLLATWGSSDITMELSEVRAHMNQYEEDTGR